MRVIFEGGEIDVGRAEVNPTLSLLDFSRRVTDDFGVTTVVPRGFSRRMSVRLALPSDEVDRVQRQFAELRATPARWIVDESSAWLDFEGFYKDFEIDLALPPLSYCTLTVEGLAETEAAADPIGDPAPGGASTLRLIRPVDVTSGMLTSTIPETDHPEWSAGTSYAIGARVIKASTHRIYESLAAANLAHDPEGVEGYWLDVGATNRWAMFDEALGSATTGTNSIAVTIDADGVDAVALLDVSAATVRVQTTGYNRIVPAGDGAITFLDLPLANAPITVTITGTGPVAAGTLLIGRQLTLGRTGAAPTAGITDFSRKETDDFGETTIVERAWAKRMAARALIRTDALDLVLNRIAAVRARPSLWIGDDGFDSLTIYGFARDASIERGESVSTLSLTIEGLSKAAPVAPPSTDVVDWEDIADPDGTKPEDNATVGAPPGTPVGDRPAEELVDQVDAATDAIGEVAARAAILETETIPAIDAAIDLADGRITEARGRADEARSRADAARARADAAFVEIGEEATRLDSRIDSVAATGGYDDTAIYAEVTSVREAAIGRDVALGERIDTVTASIDDTDASWRAETSRIDQAAIGRDVALGQSIDTVEASIETTDTDLRALVQTARQAAVDGDTALGERIDMIVADGNGGDQDMFARSEISRVEQASISRDGALGERIDTVTASIGPAINAKAQEITTAYAAADTALAERASLLEASYGIDSGLTPNGTFQNGTAGWYLDQNAEWVGSTGDATGVIRATAAPAAVSGPRMAVQQGKSYRLRTRFVSRGFGMMHYAGLRCFDGGGGFLGNIYIPPVAGQAQPYDIITAQGVFAGEQDFGPPPTFGARTAFPIGTRAVEPIFLLNHDLTGASGPLICDLDYLYLEDASDFAAASARISDAETALIDGLGAAAQRSENIEVAVGEAVGRIGGVETAVSDGRFAAAQRVDELEVEYGDTKATVSQHVGAITGLGQRTAAYVRFVADAGNGRAALSLWSDQSGGAWSLTGDGQIDGNLTINGTLKAQAFDKSSMARESASVWTGSITPAPGQTIVVPWSLALSQVPPLGRFIYEYTLGLSTDAGSDPTGWHNGLPFYTYVLDDGGLVLRALDNQGNSYFPRANRSSLVLATTDFVPNFTASISRGNVDTGLVHQGDHYTRHVSATYTLGLIDLKVTWVAI